MSKKIYLAIAFFVLSSGLSQAGWVDKAKDKTKDALSPVVADIGAALAGGLDERGVSMGFPGGEISFRLTASGISNDNEVINLDYLPVPWISGAVGLPKGINLFVRGMNLEIKGAGESLTLLGGGATYNLIKDRLINPLPALSLIAAYNSLTASGFKINTTSLGLVASKKILILRPRAGIFYDMTRSEIKAGGVTLKPDANAFRLSAGLEVSPFPFIFLS